MAALPATASFVGATVTEDQFKTAISDQRSFLAGLLGTTGERGAALTAIGASLNGVLSKSATYTVLAADRGKLIDFTTAGCDLNLPAVSVGDGFVVAFRNSASSGNVTLKAADTIDGIAGATGIPIGPGESGFAVCNGTAWKTVGKTTPPVGRFVSAKQVITSGGALTIAHGLASTPYRVDTFLRCETAEHGFSSGDLIMSSPSEYSRAVSGRGAVVTWDATNIYIRYGNNADVFETLTKGGGVSVGCTNANWRFVVGASL